MQDDPTPITVVLVPLRDRSGAIRAFALIDPADAEAVCAFRWHIRNREGYVATTIDNQPVSLQRFLIGDDAPSGHVIDHRNGWRLDNRRCNLRFVTTAQNAQNQGSRGGSSQYRGVTWDKSREKWMATAMLDGRRRTIGRFDSEEEANAAVMAWRAQHMPYSAEAA